MKTKYFNRKIIFSFIEKSSVVVSSVVAIDLLYGRFRFCLCFLMIESNAIIFVVMHKACYADENKTRELALVGVVTPVMTASFTLDDIL